MAEPPAGMSTAPRSAPASSPPVTHLHGYQMVGYTRPAEMLADLLGLKISEGAIANMPARAAEPFAACAHTIQ